MGPPQCGQAQAASLVFATTAAWTSAMVSCSRHSASDTVRWRWARKPKLRMRTNRRGRMCCKKRRRISWASSHDALLTTVRVIFPAERSLPFGGVGDAVIGDRDAMSVAGEILRYVLRSAKGRSYVHHPFLTMQRSQKCSKRFLLFQYFERSGQAQSFFAPKLFESRGKLAAKHCAQHPFRQKEVRTGVDPALMIRRKSAGGNHAMHVRMMLECLFPGVQHAQESEFGAQAFWGSPQLPAALLRWL
jgi:hypothetical protein